jgi:biopolymer transport protein TolR
VIVRRPRKQLSQINVVPLIDVVLVLLIVFMITAPFINPGQVELPRMSRTQAAPLSPIEVTVEADGALSLRDGEQPGPARAMSHAELAAYVEQRQKIMPDQPVVIAGDKSVRYERIMEVMNLMQNLKVKRVGLLARQES